MNIGDYVVVTDCETIYIGEISTDYRYDKRKATGKGSPHQRGVKWICEPVLRGDLTLGLRSSLKSPRTSVELTHRYRDIQIALGQIVEDVIKK